MFDRGRPPEELTGYAGLLEELGADDLGVVEDLGWTGSISATALALAATRALRVGLGIAPVALRNAALLAMEAGNLARVHPGRLAVAFGLLSAVINLPIEEKPVVRAAPAAA